MIRRPPRSTRTDNSFPTRRSSDLLAFVCAGKVSVLPGILRPRLHPFHLGIEIEREDGGDRIDLGRGRSNDRRDQRREDKAEQTDRRSEEHTSELQSLMRISYAVFCLKKKKTQNNKKNNRTTRQP